MKQIRQFEVAEIVEGFFLIKSIETKVTNTNKSYLDLILCDKSGEINAKIWEFQDSQFQLNSIIKIRGVVKEWNGSKQLNILKVRMAIENDGVNIEDFVPSSPIPLGILLQELRDYISKIDDNEMKKIVEKIIDKYRDKITFFPAAQKNHHSIRTGWLYHVVTMLKAGEKLLEVYQFLNKSLLFSGIILHDIAKLDEMDANELGFVTNYTIEGHLLGHIVQGVKLVDAVATELGTDEEVSLLLQHLIVSHHYKSEWGSPKSPMIPEAEILHYLDIIDAHMYDMKMSLDQTRSGEMSDRIWTLDRRIYKTK